MKIKNAAVFLMIGSIYGILIRVYYIIDAFSETRLEYTKENLIKWGFDSFSIILPISLLVLSIALMNNKTDVVSNEKEEVLSQGNEQNLTVGDWLVNFLITIIPLVGFIFIIIWANDDKNKIRKNWAVASLIWSGIIFVLSIFLYATIFAAIMKRY
jgi:cytochrome bd-type quinol oxidase subunit 2